MKWPQRQDIMRANGVCQWGVPMGCANGVCQWGQILMLLT